MPRTLDPRLTFDSFQVGPSNHVAAGAARRVAESPGASYNPLVIHGGPGLGKTHLLSAIGHLARALRPDLQIQYATAEEYTEWLASGVASGTYHYQQEHLGLGLVLLDDLHFLEGKGNTQAELLWIWEAMVDAGEQVVLAAGRPLAEIDGLDQRLIGRFSGGLIVDITAPDLATRTAIVARKATDAGAALDHGVAEAIARVSFDNVRELEERLARVLAVQQRERRWVTAAEVFSLLGAEAPEPKAAPSTDEFSSFILDITSTVAEVVDTTPWRQMLAGAVLRWEGEGIRTWRLEQALEGGEPTDVNALLDAFSADVARLRAIERELVALDPSASGAALLRDPDRVREAEAWLVSARGRTRVRSGRPAGRGAVGSPVPAIPHAAASDGEAEPQTDRWFYDREKIAWSWAGLEDRLIEELG